MKQTFNRIFYKLFSFLPRLFRQIPPPVDHKKLTQQILTISQQHSSMEMISEMAGCLKESLDYQLFAFILEQKTSLKVWLDPQMYQAGLESVLLRDFPLSDKSEITHMNLKASNTPELPLDLENLMFYDKTFSDIHFRIYLMADDKNTTCQDEIVNLVFEGSAIALSQQIKIEKLQNAAVIDPLTGCYNRRELENQLKRNIAGSVRHKNPLSIFMFDLDHFKRINDTFGHLAGDKVLKAVTRLVKDNMRSNDILARYGGEEFIALLPETGRNKAIELADRLREKIAGMEISWHTGTINVSASFGVAQLNPMAEMNKIIQDADTMLYRAKINGRNTVMPGLFKVVPEKEAPERKETFL